MIREHQRIPVTFFNRICMLIFPFPLFPLQISFWKYYETFKSKKNGQSKTFFTIRNSSTSNLVVQHSMLSWIKDVTLFVKDFFFIKRLFLTWKFYKKCITSSIYLYFWKPSQPVLTCLGSTMEALFCEICETCMETNVGNMLKVSNKVPRINWVALF